MEGSPKSLRDVLENFLEHNFPSNYTSCIKIQGRPILPPLMTEERRIEMRRLRDLAVEIERKQGKRKSNDAHEDCTGGEAMYEEVGDELHFANSLPTSLLPSSEETVQCPEVIENNEQHHYVETCSYKTDCDMLKEFDPLAGEEHENSNSLSVSHVLEMSEGETSDKLGRLPDETTSKPSSTENSVSLSYSTDLNQYLDVTESSADLSVPCFDVDLKSSGGTRGTTPSTMRPDSVNSNVLSGIPWKNVKSTYEDLNNYLDSLLTGNSYFQNREPLKDNNENVLGGSTSSQSSQSTLSPTSLPQGHKAYGSSPPPLISPQGSLQTKIVIGNECKAASIKETVEEAENTSNFLQNCALSPVKHVGVKNSYEEKVHLYLQNLMIDDGTIKKVIQPESVKDTQSSGENCKGSEIYRVSDQPVSESNNDVFLQSAPRLVRSNSYTLESPSPMLLAHMEAELKNNAKNGKSLNGAPVPQKRGNSRNLWDSESTKNMPNWSTRANPSFGSSSKIQSPKKTFKKSSAAKASQPDNTGSYEICSDVPQRQIKGKSTSHSPQQRKTVVPSHSNEEVDEMKSSTMSMPETEPTACEEPKDKVRALLLQLQLQHNQEMEQLLDRQRKEKEAIRLALLEEQRSKETKFSEEILSKPSFTKSPPNSQLNEAKQSPPTKDSVPKVSEKEINNLISFALNSQENLVPDEVPHTLGKAPGDLLNEGKTGDNVLPHGQGVNKTSDVVLPEYSHNHALTQENYNVKTQMVSSFPPSDLPYNAFGSDILTCSLPPDVLSLHFSNTEVKYKNSHPVSCNTQSSVSISKSLQMSSDNTSVTQSIITSALMTNVSSGSPRNKRRSWCSRQLFPESDVQTNPDWLIQAYETRKIQAVIKIQAGVRGYLTRRLLKTERVQNCITTIKDTVICALQLQRDCAPHVEPSDVVLHGRLIQQLSAACEELHHIFMGLPIRKRMFIIASDRERLRNRTPRSGSSTGSRPLSRATQIALQRKLNQSDPVDTMSIHSRGSSTNRSRRRSWAPIDSRVRSSLAPTSSAHNSEIVPGCLSRTSAPSSLPLQRSASAGSNRKPWR